MESLKALHSANSCFLFYQSRVYIFEMLICRLGHREQKDEWVPRRVEVFSKHNVLPADAVISAGSANSACTAGIICSIFNVCFIDLVLVKYFIFYKIFV